MIKTVSDFIDEFIRKGKEVIKEYEPVKHPVLIGDMYEGLTKEFLDKAIFEGLNLRIVGGKIKNSNGKFSDEIDCMLVAGKGEQIPFTDKFIYHHTKVIAVIQVKKTLYSDTLGSAFANLMSVVEVSREPDRDGEAYMTRLLREAWRGLTKSELPSREELKEYDEIDRRLYHVLLMETYFPLRIVLGYSGFKNEYALREGFIRYMANEANGQPLKGHGPGSLPSLIICGQNSLVKNNGMPYSKPFSKEEFYWPLYLSSGINPIYHLLQIIWTRLTYKFGISSQVFGDDFDFEPMCQFLDCRMRKFGEGDFRWEYYYSQIPKKEMAKLSNKKNPWTPAFLSKKQVVVITELCISGVLSYEDLPIFMKAAADDGESVRDFIDRLVETGLIYDKGNEIRLLVDECLPASLPDGRYCAGENKNGEVLNWIRKQNIKA